MDPPYAVKFGSNFQPFVRKRGVTHGADDDMVREPEMVQAYRDTWELGVHSFLTYLRDRLLLARDLLHPSGSIFVQMSDTNLHHVREVMDEAFGAPAAWVQAGIDLVMCGLLKICGRPGFSRFTVCATRGSSGWRKRITASSFSISKRSIPWKRTPITGGTDGMVPRLQRDLLSCL